MRWTCFALWSVLCKKNSLMNGIMGISLAVFSTDGFATTPERYWKSIDDRTGEQLSIVEVKKKPDGTYTGTIVYRYPVLGGGNILTNCVKCPEPFKNKPILVSRLPGG